MAPPFAARPWLIALLVGLALTAVALHFALRGPTESKPPAGPREEVIDGKLIIAGVEISTAAPVITWRHPRGYDAHLETCWFDRTRELPSDPGGGTPNPKRYRERSPLGLKPASLAVVQRSGWTRETLAEKVDQFVLHYDVAGVSRSCFRVLHDVRGLSVHFLLDLDGTIYQTLDLAHRGLHATIANDRSIGIEIAQMGAYENPKRLAEWYRPDETGRLRIHLARWQGDGGFFRSGFVPRPASDEVLRGKIHGRLYHQHDFTAEQYRSLVLLTRSLGELFPKMELDAPRERDGAVAMRALSAAEFERFQGILGHFHVQENKQDPGPAFRWEPFLAAVRRTGSPDL